MLKTMRTNTKWIMIVVAVCFVGMIIFAWGMDITGSRSGGGATGIVGSINGDKIPWNTYKNIVDNQLQQYGGGNRLPLAQQRRVYEEAWNSIITQKVVEQEIAKRKITYTDQELVNFMRNNPPQIAYSPNLAPLFQDENGQFSMAKYQAFLNPQNLQNPQSAQLLQYIEMEAAGRLPAMKFQDSLTNAIQISDTQVRDQWLMENEKRNMSYFFINANSVPAETVTVDEAGAKAYFEANKDDFKKEARRTVDYVFVPLQASAADSAEVRDVAKMLMGKIKTGTDFATLANEYSDDPGNTGANGEKKGGDLGLFGKGRMVPAFEEAVFGLKPGEVSEPVETRFGIHIIKCDSLTYKKDAPKEVDQVKASHILLRIEPSRETRDMVEGKVTAFREAVEGGSSFADRAAADGMQILTSVPLEKDIPSIPGIMGSTKINVNRVFAAKKGDLIQVYYTENGYYLMSLGEILHAGIPAFEDVKTDVESQYRKTLQAKEAEKIAARINDRIKAGKTIKEAVDEDEFKKVDLKVADVYKNLFISGLGAKNLFVAKMFQLENPGDSTGIFVDDNGAGIAVLNEIKEIDEAAFETAKENIRTRLLSEKRNQILSSYVQKLIDDADIVDHRHLYVGL